MEELSKFIEAYSPVLQQCLLSNDPLLYLNSLPESLEKSLISYLIQPHSIDYKQTMRTQYRIRGSLLDLIDQWKVSKKLSSAKTISEIKYLLDVFIEENNTSFNIAKPSQFNSSPNYSKEQQKLLPSKLKPIKRLHQWVAEQLQKNQDLIGSLNKKSILTISEQRLKNLKTSNKERFLRTPYIKQYTDRFGAQFVKKFYQEMAQSNKNYEIPTDILRQLSKGQFLLLPETIENITNKPEYLKIWFDLQYGQSLEAFNKIDQLTISEKDEKRVLLLRILGDLDQLKTSKTRSMKNAILKQLVILDISREDIDQHIFIEYITNNVIQSSLQSSKNRKQKQQRKRNDRQEQIQLRSTFNSNIDYDKVILTSLENLFEKPNAAELLKQLQDHFDGRVLNKIYAKKNLSKGGSFQVYKNYFAADELKEFKEEKMITILETNKRVWGVDEQIILKTKIKNVKTININVYKLDLEKHYRENNQAIEKLQDLSYFHPQHSQKRIVNNQNSFIIQIFDFKIQGIPNEKGAWIVEFEAEGISSRAFIRKGSVLMFSKNGTNGTELKFFDETGQRIRNYVIWMEGKRHDINKDKFILPYGETNNNVSLILLKDSFAEKFDLGLPQQSYKLNIDYIYNSQSFIVGGRCKIILHPKITLSFDKDIDISLQLLQKVNILVTFTNNVGIKSTIDFDNIQLKSSEDYLLQFPIQTYTTSIEILVKAKIKKYNQKYQQLSAYQIINIDLAQDSTTFIDLYLKKCQGNYYLSLLGRNGETVPNTEVSLEIYPVGRTKPQTQTLMTSKQGIIELGTLDDINRLIAKVMTKSGDIGRQWYIDEVQSEIDISSGSVFLKGEDIYLPYLKEQQYSLWRKDKNGGGFIEKMINKIRFEAQKVCIRDLPVGDYELQFYTTDKKVNFSVVDGRQWSEQKKIFDQKRGVLYELNPYQNYHFTLGEAVIKKKNGKSRVEVPILSTYDTEKDSSFRAHIIASNFITPTFKGQFNIKKLRNQRNCRQDLLEPKKSQYFNNKKLSDESSYIMNRKNENKYIGNNLEKPKLFLHRIEVRDTKQAEEELSDGQYYQKQKRFQMAKESARSRMKADALFKEEQKRKVSIDLLTTHNNFLQLSSYVIANYKKGRVIEFQLPQGYSHFQCFLSSRFSGVARKYFLQTGQPLKKNLVHVGIPSSSHNQSWTMSRQVYKVNKNQTLKVSRNSTWSAVGLTNIIGFAKTKGITIEDWVINWNTYTDEQKLSVYNEHISHQLNAYIKYNDQPFFQKIVLPFLKNKIIKTFVDYCLLEEKEALTWAQLHLYQLLNEFEKVLLVHQLIKANRKQEAEIIASSMQNLNKSNRISFETFKKEFDTVIAAKLTEQVALGVKDEKRKLKKKKTVHKQEMYASNKESAFCFEEQCDEDQGSQRGEIMQSFKQLQNTKQYTQTTYKNVKYAYESQKLVKPSPFWTSVAQNLIKGNRQLLSQNFMYLNSSVQFTLASCFIPTHKLLQFGLKAESQNYLIEASSSFLVFVKEVKLLPFQKKFGILLNQRFFNPDDRYYYEEDGTKIQKQIHQFIVRRAYCLQTLITNTSGSKLELQLLIDLPEGTIPLKSHENTQIFSINLEPYSTLSFESYFYFPNKGSYRLYPANVCRGDLVISKAQEIEQIEVFEVETIKSMDTFEDVLKSGQSQKVLQFLQSKNIFDSKIFNARNILWMLKDKQFFLKVIQLLKRRKYYSSQIWIFAYYHEELEHIVEYQNMISFQKEEDILSSLPIYEYFPYYSKRTHKFLNETKSIIRNIELKKTYLTFLFTSFLIQPSTPRSRITFIYYLLLQDRIDEANNLLALVSQKQKAQYLLQFDYIESFIDMYKGFPSFTVARRISEKYRQHPIKAWRKLFNQIYETLREYDNNTDYIQENLQVEYSTTVFNQDNQIRISIPANTQVEIFYYEINLEVYFSNFPFTNFSSFAPSIAPNRFREFPSGLSRQQKLVFDSTMKDTFIEVFSSTSNLQKKKVSSFLWSNPKIKIRIKQDRGEAQIFFEGRKQPGCYCKVYQMQGGQSKFYRDGYTDITGTFKYALADLEGVSEFAILFVTENSGGKIVRVKPPSQQTYLK